MTTQTQREPVDPEQHTPDNPSTRRLTYAIIGVVLIVLLILGVLLFGRAQNNTAANAKADQLIVELQQAGLPVPRKESVVNLLGDDGGAVCANPTSYLKLAAARERMSNGAGGPGMRPVLSSRQIVDAERIVIKTYCPQYLAEYDDFIESHVYSDVVKE